MSNYTRTIIRIWPSSDDMNLNRNSLQFICDSIRESLYAWGNVQIICATGDLFAEFRFSCKRCPKDTLASIAKLGYEVWALTTFDGGSCRDELTWCSPGMNNIYRYNGIGDFSVDEVVIKTGKPNTTAAALGIESLDYRKVAKGFSVDCAGTYSTETFLYYGTDEFEDKFLDEVPHLNDLEKSDASEGSRIVDLLFSKEFPLVNQFVEHVAKSWGLKRKFPRIQRVEFKFQGQTKHVFFYDSKNYRQPFWRHLSHDDFSNVVNEEYLAFSAAMPSTQ